MLILHTAQTYPPQVGGVSEVVRQISERLARRGHEVHVATSAMPGCSAQEIVNGVHVHRFDVRGNWVTGMHGQSGDYINFVKSRSWDTMAFHCAQTWSTDLLLGNPLAEDGVFVAHGLSAFHNPAYDEYFGRLAEWVRQGMSFVSLSSIGVEDQEFLRRYELTGETIIPNGVDLEEWSAPRLNIREKLGDKIGPWLVNVSNHNPAKGHARLFNLLGTLKSRHKKLMLTQIGRCSPAGKYSLGRIGIKGGCWYRCKAKSYHEPSIRLESAMPRKHVVSMVQEADLTVLTSLQEASPLVVLESMAAGTPFVAFNVGCVREHPGGIVVDSVQEMADAVTRLLGDSELRKSLGAAGLSRIKERHDWEVITSQYESLYRTKRDSHKPQAVGES